MNSIQNRQRWGLLGIRALFAAIITLIGQSNAAADACTGWADAAKSPTEKMCFGLCGGGGKKIAEVYAVYSNNVPSDVQIVVEEWILTSSSFHTNIHASGLKVDVTFNGKQPAKATLTAKGFVSFMIDACVSPYTYQTNRFTLEFELEAREDCKGGCEGDCSRAPGDEEIEVNSIHINFALGAFSDQESAGVILVDGNAPFADLSKPVALRVPFRPSGPAGSVEVYPSVGGPIEQVRAPQALVHVQVVSDWKYYLHFFYSNNVTGSSPPYGTNASAFVSWMIENPDTTASTNRLRLTEIKGGIPGRQFTFAVTNESGIEKLSLTQGDQTQTVTVWHVPDSMDSAITNYVREVRGGGTLLQKVQEIYTNAASGKRLLQRIEGEGAATKVTSYSYDGLDWSVRIQHPDGGWEVLVQDWAGRVTDRYMAYGNSPPLPEVDLYEMGPTNVYKVVRYTYGLVVPGDGTPFHIPKPDMAREETVSITVPHQNDSYIEQEISRIYRSAPSDYEQIEWYCPNPHAEWDDPANEWTRTVQYGMDHTNRTDKTGKTHFQVHRDGTISLYDYQFDNGVLTNIVVETGEADVGDLLTNVPTAVINGTRTETALDSLGKVLARTVRAITNGNLSILLDQDIYTYLDALQRDYMVVNLAGTTNYFESGCCGVQSSTDADGVTTSHVQDALGRTIATTVTRGTSVIQVTNLFDAVGQRLMTVRLGSDGGPITLDRTQFDVLGRAVRHTNALGGVAIATNTMVNGRVVVTNTYPDGGTRIQVYYVDGRLEEVTGTAVAPVRYVYGMEEDDGPWREFTTEIRLGTGGETNEWTKTFVDGLGRPYKTIYSTASGPYPSRKQIYNNQGQVWKEVDPDGAVTLYTFDTQGRPEYQITAISETALGIQSYAGLVELIPTLKEGTDRITRTLRTVVPAGDGRPDRQRVETYIWKDGDSIGTLVTRAEVSADGLQSWNTAFPSPSVPVASWTVTEYATGGWRTNTAYSPDGSHTVSIFRYGQLQSTTQKSATGSQVMRTTYSYDTHGRQHAVADARNGTTRFVFNNADQVIITISPDAGLGAQETVTYYDNMGRTTGTRQPDGSTTTNIYHKTGLLMRTWGSSVYPVGYGYDAQGRMRFMTNWQNFSGSSGVAVTRWNYDGYRGWLASKDYPNASTGAPDNNSGPSYTYTDAGRLATRTWKRSVVTTYTYNEAGELARVNYSDSTPAVTNTYDRFGRQKTVVSAGITNTYAYNDVGLVISNGYTGGVLTGIVVTNGYDEFLRRTNLYARTGVPSTLNHVNYAYDTAGRLSIVSNAVAGVSATYAYLANSPLVEQITFKSNSVTRMTTTKSYDRLNRLTSISSVNSGSEVLSSHGYLYNEANQRTRATLGDGSYWVYSYDALGQVTSGKRYWADGTLVAGQDFDFTFDDTGNRDKTGGRASARSDYTANRLNQYTQRTNAPFVDVLGIANPTANVEVNDNVASRKGEYFHWALNVANTTAQYPTVTVESLYGVTQTESGGIFVPPATETYTYDLDGNLTQDGRWNYEWDGENRLKIMRSRSGSPAPERRIEFTYDSQSRRIRKAIYNDRDDGQGILLSDTRFVYDRWNLIAIFNSSFSLLQSFTWGLDLSGSEQGAGGVGGLLAVYDTSTISSQPSAHFVTCDGNGNVTALADATSGSVSARYEYGPFGESVRSSGAMAQANPFRFSTKVTDNETGLLYYGYRYYDSGTGRWLTRDPLEEQGGEGLYVFAANASTCYIDLFGLCSEHSLELSIPRIQIPKIPMGAIGYFEGSVSISVTLSGKNCRGNLEGKVSGAGAFEASVTVGRKVEFVAGGIRFEGMIGFQAGAEALVVFNGGYRHRCGGRYGELFFSGGFTVSPFIRGGAFLEFSYPKGWPRRIQGPPWGKKEILGVMLEGKGTLDGTVDVECSGPKCVVFATRETSAQISFKWSLGWLSGYHRIWEYPRTKSQKEKLLEFDNPLRRD